MDILSPDEKLIIKKFDKDYFQIPTLDDNSACGKICHEFIDKLGLKKEEIGVDDVFSVIFFDMEKIESTTNQKWSWVWRLKKDFRNL